MNLHKKYLIQALALAQSRRGFCTPNPSVGAVIVKNQQIIGQGRHMAAGTPHAEIHALNQAQQLAAGATLYITLEPCSHHGRTPPCVNAIKAAKIAQVYYAYRDPDPRVQGSGEKVLLDAGIACQHIPLVEINDFYRSYQHWQQHQTPWVTAKLALSMDGKIAFKHGKPAQITGSAVKIFTHQKRLAADAILSTTATVLNDDPQLNVRLGGHPAAKNIYLLDSSLRLPSHAKLLTTAQSITVFHSAHADSHRRALLTQHNIRCIEVPLAKGGLDLHAVIQQIGQDGVHDLWVEAGSQCFNALLQQHLLQEAYLYVAPQFLGTDAQATQLTNYDFSQTSHLLSWEHIGNDCVLHAMIDTPKTAC